MGKCKYVPYGRCRKMPRRQKCTPTSTPGRSRVSAALPSCHTGARRAARVILGEVELHMGILLLSLFSQKTTKLSEYIKAHYLLRTEYFRRSFDRFEPTRLGENIDCFCGSFIALFSRLKCDIDLRILLDTSNCGLSWSSRQVRNSSGPFNANKLELRLLVDQSTKIWTKRQKWRQAATAAIAVIPNPAVSNPQGALENLKVCRQPLSAKILRRGVGTFCLLWHTQKR